MYPPSLPPSTSAHTQAEGSHVVPLTGAHLSALRTTQGPDDPYAPHTSNSGGYHVTGGTSSITGCPSEADEVASVASSHTSQAALHSALVEGVPLDDWALVARGSAAAATAGGGGGSASGSSGTGGAGAGAAAGGGYQAGWGSSQGRGGGLAGSSRTSSSGEGGGRRGPGWGGGGAGAGASKRLSGSYTWLCVWLCCPVG